MIYRVVKGTDYQTFLKTVQSMIDEGWQPQGGVAVRTRSDDSVEHYQAMVRHNG